ncbi:hypothetical protein QE357_004751 [Siphonobacter sp. BAB-5404]|nr:hypothetical protein [Siphonobacter sp. SORGH_AS_0500]
MKCLFFLLEKQETKLYLTAGRGAAKVLKRPVTKFNDSILFYYRLHFIFVDLLAYLLQSKQHFKILKDINLLTL